MLEENLAQFTSISDELSVCEALNLILSAFKSQTSISFSIKLIV